MSEHPQLIDQRNWSATGVWRDGAAISLDNLLQGTGPIERITSQEWFRSGGQQAAAASQSCKEWKPPQGTKMGFGKYREKLMADVREDDPRYFRWCCDEIHGFKEKAKKAGLMDE